MNIDFRFYLSLFLRRIHYFLLFLAIGTAAGITLATVLPPVYDAQARLLWQSATIDTDGGIETVATERLQILEQRVLTRASILEMVNRLDVYAPRPGEDRRQMTGDEIVEDMRERVQINVTGGVDRRGAAQQATIVTVSFAAPNGRLAANVANEVVELMLEENIEISVGGVGGNVEFYRTRVAELGRELSEQSQTILEFQQANPEALPESLEFRRSLQAAAQERLLTLQRDETRLRDQRETLVRVYEETGQILGTAAANSRLSPEERQLQDLQSQLSVMLLTLAPTHPRVRQLEGQIAAIEQVVSAQRAASGDVQPAGGALSEYDLRLADLDGQLAFIADQQDQIRRELEDLRVSIEATPGNAITLETMQRDYANTRAQYDEFVALLAGAETAEVVVRTNRDDRLEVIENAVAPREPTSPNRPVVAAAGIGGGLFVGLAVIALLELLNSAVRRPADISNKLGITPLGTIPHIRTRMEIMRRRAIIIAIFALVLIALPAALWFIHVNITPLDVMLNSILIRFGLPLL